MPNFNKMNAKMGAPHAQAPKGTAKRLFSMIVKGNVLRLVVVVLAIIVSAAASVGASVFLESLIDDYSKPLLLMDAPVFTDLLHALAGMACLYAAGLIATYLYNRIMVTVSQRTLKDIRDRMFSHMQSLPIRYFDTHPHGDIMSVYTNDVDTLRQMISQSIPQAMSSVISIIAVFCSMLVMSWQLTIVVLICVAIMLSARPARTRPRSQTSSTASMTLPTARFAMTVSTSTRSKRTICAARWALFYRIPTCLPAPCARTSAMAVWMRPTRKSRLRQSWQTLTSPSAVCPRATTPC